MQIQDTIKKKKLVPVLTRCDEIKVGDILRTSRGDLPVSGIMKSYIFGGERDYVRFVKGCFDENYPDKDVFITSDHPISVGYINNEKLNNGVKDLDQDDKVFIHMKAGSFVNKIPGIKVIKKKVKSQYNFIFDEHVSFNVGGIDVISHHPSGYNGQRKLEDNEYHDKNVPKKKWRPFYISYETLLKLKPEEMSEKEFIGKCLRNNTDEKFKIEEMDPNDSFLKSFNETVHGKMNLEKPKADESDSDSSDDDIL
jgi:hypothetical protein